MRDWLAANGWKDEIFLDLDPQRGIAAGERWERALHEAANRCEAVLFLVSKAWLGSGWCRKEFNLAHRLNKRLFGVLIEDLPVGELPEELAGHLANRAPRRRPRSCHAARGSADHAGRGARHLFGGRVAASQARAGGSRSRRQVFRLAADRAIRTDRPIAACARSKPRTPASSLAATRPIIEALDRLRGLRETTPPRLLVILGASGAGKSSFLRAGLFPRLARDDRNFLPLPIIRPERAAISGETGLLRCARRRICGGADRDTACRPARGHPRWRRKAQAAPASARR